MSLLLATLSLFYYISAPVVEMREEPKINSEVVSQAYHSEEVNLLEETQYWVKIETIVDHYQGWVKKGSLCQREEAFPSHLSHLIAKVNRCAAHLYHVEDTSYGPIVTLPFDSKFEVLDPKQDSASRWIKVALIDGREGYIQRGDVSLKSNLLNKEQMCKLSLQFLGLPYTWGGRSSFGYDCSGFVQMLYRQMGIALPRDSKDQMRWKDFVDVAIEEMIPGDLIFFGFAEDKIRHVGMSLGKGQFIHATVAENQPYIRISNVTDPEWSGFGKFGYRAAKRFITTEGTEQ